MSVHAMSWVWEHSKAKGSSRLVLLALADHAGQDGGDAYPSVARIARRCGLSTRTVQGAIKELHSLGELVIDVHAGQRGTNRYRIVMTPADPAPPQNLHPADIAPDPRRSCTPPPQNLSSTPAESAPEPLVTVSEPSLTRSLSRDLVVARRRPEPSPPRFDEFWDAYPRKDSKGAAKTAWRKAVKVTDPDTIIAGAVRYRNDPRREPRFTKHPGTWLNAECWADEGDQSVGVSKSTRNAVVWALRGQQ